MTLEEIIQALEAGGITIEQAVSALQSSSFVPLATGRRAKTDQDALGILQEAGFVVPEEEAERLLASGEQRDQFAELPAREEALRDALAARQGRGRTFQEFVGSQFNPGASPFLRSGLERRFGPLNTLFEGQGALGQLASAIGGSAQALGNTITFEDFIGNRGGAAPTQATLGNLASQAASALQQGPLSTRGEEFFRGPQGPENQFQIALQSVLGGVPRFLQGGFQRTARRKFEDFQAQNPERAAEFLIDFVNRGSRF
jgi:hypothetical protein